MRFRVGAPALSIIAILAVWGEIAFADDNYPSRPVRLIVPYGAGGASDVMARQFGQKLSERIGQPVVIENQAAAAGTVAYTTVARAAPDGYTLAYGTSSIAVNAVLKAKPAYDPVADFQPVSLILSVQNVLVVPNMLQARTVGELVQLAKAKPDELNYVSLGPGSTPHLSAELFRAAAGIKLQQVSYKQTTQAYTDLRKSSPSSGSPPCRVLCRTSNPKSYEPSLSPAASAHRRCLRCQHSQSGIAAESTFWQGLFAPAGTPIAIVQTQHCHTADCLRARNASMVSRPRRRTGRLDARPTGRGSP